MDTKLIDEFKQKMDTLHDSLKLNDFKRLHAKFFACVLSIEVGFKKKFPKEWEEYEREFYNEG